VILPGKTIGILGGGQLGRMFAIAARRLGYRVHALDPATDCPTGQVADLEINARYDDLDAARAFASAVDVVTFEFENVPADTLTAIEHICPVRPSPFVLETTRHRLREKDFLSGAGFPVAPYRAIRTADDLHRAVAELGTPCILKTAECGYDGKGQVKITDVGQVEIAHAQLKGALGVLEGFVRFDREISAIVARAEDGQTRCFTPLENVHRNHILDLTTTLPPADPLFSKAQRLAERIAGAIGLVGVLCVEMFARGDELIVNELAPRPHNSGHLTIDACVTCQFEQQLRAVCGLPLGDPSLEVPAAAMANLLGEVWAAGEPHWDRALAIEGVKLHLYGKHDPRPGRKMGHLTATASTVGEAKQRVLAARDALTAK
jgi:5-(carboxyamino)imidazole ribonucleotide synthase